MPVFFDYAKYYDLLYTDKPYQTEADFVHGLLLTYATKPIEHILELGTGTGKHAYHLAEKGYDVHGVDQSQTMLEMAGQLCLNAPSDIKRRIHLEQGDIRTLSINKRFDAAISLFHVLSYQTTNACLKATFETVKRQLNPGGLFIFDCWYGPAVLTHQPEVRFKQFSNNEISIERISVPTLYENENKVEVNYHLFVKNNSDAFYQRIQETHKMRYLFVPEIEKLCESHEMKLLHASEWLTTKPLSVDTFGACFVIKI